MMPLPPGTRVYLACRPVDMRKGFDGLAAQVSTVLRADPYSGHVFVFRGKRGDYVKRLEQCRFVWPPIIDDCLHLTPAQLALLIEGIDWRRTIPIDVPRQPAFV
jgi:transposase